MPPTEGASGRLEELLYRRSEGGLDEAENAELAEMLARSPAGRHALVTHAWLSGALKDAAPLRARASPRAERRSPLAAVVMVAVLAAAAVAFAVGILPPRRRSPTADQNQTFVRLLRFEKQQLHESQQRIPQFLVQPVVSGEGTDDVIVPRPLPRTSPVAVRQVRGFQALLQNAPAEIVSGLRAWDPDEKGMFLWNQTSFVCSGHQQFGLQTLMVGSVLGNADWVDRGWSVVEATFGHQTAEGNFGDPAVCVAQWLGTLGVALDTLEAGPFAPAYSRRIEALKPALRRAGTWLAAEAQVSSLKRGGSNFPNPSFIAAAGLSSLAVRVGEPNWLPVAEELADRMLNQQRPDGAFEHNGGPDSGFQAYQLLQLHTLVATLSAPRYLAAARRGGAWLLTRVKPDGTLDLNGNTYSVPCQPGGAIECPYVSYPALRWAITLHAARFDRQAFATEELVYRSEIRRSETQ